MQIRTKIATKFKLYGRACVGRDLLCRPDVQRDWELLGNVNAQFAICPDGLKSDSTVYSFGIGTDISFDLELIRRFGLHVHAFDPTPRSLAWVGTQAVSPKFHVHQYGVSDCDGLLEFSPPASPSHVSYTILHRDVNNGTVSAPVRRISTIMRELGHTSIDLLKMDIEGAEYGVLRDLLANRIQVRQMCIEFHHRWREVGASKTREIINAFRKSGYRIFHVSENGREYSFLGRE